MKKTIFIIALFLLNIGIYAEEKLDVKTSVELIGKELKGEEFTFYLKNTKEDIISEAKNDKNGMIEFKNISLPQESEYKLVYIISQKNPEEKGYSYDKNKVYVQIEKENNSNIKVSYYRENSLEKEMNEKTPKYDYIKPYHASSKELKGEAYAVIDIWTRTIKFVRMNSLDTSSFAIPFDSTSDKDRAVDETNFKIYYRNVETNAETFHKVFNDLQIFKNSSFFPDKVIFEDAFKPQFTELENICSSSNSYIKEYDFSHFDTSNITKFNDTFKSCAVEKLNLSYFDTSNTISMKNMFLNSKIIELDLRSFSFEKLEIASWMFADSDKLSILKIPSLSKTTKLKKADYMFRNTKELKNLDFSWLVLDETSDGTGIFSMCGLEYLDLSHWNFTMIGYNSIFATAFYLPNLKYIDISNIKTDECGSYASSDFNFYPITQVIKLSNQFNGMYNMLRDTNTDRFNTNINDYTGELAGDGTRCKYYAGGSYLNIQNTESGNFTNYYNEEKEVIEDKNQDNTLKEEIEKNPNPNTTSSPILMVLIINTISLSIIYYFLKIHKTNQ